VVALGRQRSGSGAAGGLTGALPLGASGLGGMRYLAQIDTGSLTRGKTR
jgi:hypothetical protein